MIDVPAGCEVMATDVTCNNKKRKQVQVVVVGANKKKRKRQEAMEPPEQESIFSKAKRIFAK